MKSAFCNSHKTGAIQVSCANNFKLLFHSKPRKCRRKDRKSYVKMDFMGNLIMFRNSGMLSGGIAVLVITQHSNESFRWTMLRGARKGFFRLKFENSLQLIWNVDYLCVCNHSAERHSLVTRASLRRIRGFSILIIVCELLLLGGKLAFHA